MDNKNYVCSCCGKKHVKLWRPYVYPSTLLCTTYAEKNNHL